MLPGHVSEAAPCYLHVEAATCVLTASVGCGLIAWKSNLRDSGFFIQSFTARWTASHRALIFLGVICFFCDQSRRHFDFRQEVLMPRHVPQMCQALPASLLLLCPRLCQGRSSLRHVGLENCCSPLEAWPPCHLPPPPPSCIRRTPQPPQTVSGGAGLGPTVLVWVHVDPDPHSLQPLRPAVCRFPSWRDPGPRHRLPFSEGGESL